MNEQHCMGRWRLKRAGYLVSGFILLLAAVGTEAAPPEAAGPQVPAVVLPPQAAERARQEVAEHTAPNVSLTAPAEGALYTAPAAVVLEATASASSPGRSLIKVEFYQGATLIGTASAAPYAFSWAPVAAGRYALTARATDNLGAQAASAAVHILVNAPPTVSLTSPTANTVFTAPATISLSANAADADGTVAKVEFYQGATLIGSATAAPYTVSWANVAAGNYTITAVATDDRGASTTSTAVPVIVNAPPAIAFTGPSEGATFIAPATIELKATASDADGAIARVEFFEGANLLAGMTQAPFSATWQVATPGSYTLFAKATDDRGAVAQALPVHVTVKANTPPTVSLTSPAQGASFRAPATIALAATASDSDGSIAKVEFFQGATLIGAATAAPYTVSWANVAAGGYTLTAVATDDRGAQMISGSLAITVTAAQAQVYYIHPDHLNTPRVITDQAQRIVWRWDHTDPFGGNVPDEDPDGDGQRFEFNLRFPGQYFDKETGLHYNYYRDCYDPLTGRYCQSDPIGLAGGINTYLYATDPLTQIDPLGLAGINAGQSKPAGPTYGFFFGSLSIAVPVLPFPGYYQGNTSCGSKGPQFPNVLDGVLIEKACVKHDRCYETCGVAKDICDRDFLNNIRRTCGGSPRCVLGAWIYYQAVDRFGETDFLNARKNCNYNYCFK